MISYNQQHGTISMKKYILTKYLAIWHRWKTTNLALAPEEQQWEISKEKSIVDCGVTTKSFWVNKTLQGSRCTTIKIFKNLLFVAKVYVPSSIMENQWLRCLVRCQNPQVAF
jgi:hypothetical protein